MAVPLRRTAHQTIQPRRAAVKGRWNHPEAKPIEVTDDASALVARVRRRDMRAFEALYDAHHRIVYGVALRVLGDAHGAEDVLQSVFLKLWNAPELFRGGNFGAWIVRVTRNRALDVLRSRAVRNEGELPEALPEEETIEDVAFSRIDAASVRAALSDLPAEQREPIEMGFFGGITHEEIARRCNVPLGTIKTRIRSGLRKLRAVLNETVVA
jgi:RNA polymerase sigma-70 factor (ECF subfamily)